MSRTDKGPVQKQLLDRAYASRLSLVYVADYREMRAARMLTRRGILAHLGSDRSDSRLFVLRSSIEEFLP